MTSVLRSALALVRQTGWHVFRLRIDHDPDRCDGGTASCKTIKPVAGRWDPSDDPEVIEGWDWSRANGYGIACGPSGLVVVDVDPGAVWPYPADRIHATGRGTHHFYLNLSGVGTSADVPPWGVDVRGDGGMVVGPGSYHPHGGYAVLTDGEPGPAPIELSSALTRADRNGHSPHPPAGELDPLEALDRLEGVYRRMAAAPIGSRNNTLNLMAGTAAGLWARLPPDAQTGELSAETVQERLLAAVTDDDDPAQSRGTIRSGWSYGVDHPLPDTDQVIADTADLLFAATPTLAHIRRAAHAIGRPGLPMLAFVLARVLAEVGPHVVLPGGMDGAVGRRASLNLGFAFVAGPGRGKTDISEMSEQLLGIDQRDIQRSPSTGEGLIQSFLDKGPGKEYVLGVDPRRLFNVDEIEQLTRSGSRSGATLGPIMRAMLTGGHTGTENADAALRRNLPAGSYRMVLCAGVQPDKAGPILEEEGSGLPQRFVWVPVDGKEVPHPDERPSWPGGLDLDPGLWEFLGVLDYPDHIKQQVRMEDWARAKGEMDASSGHLTLTRLKVAAALALLHGDDRITDLWWSLAGRLVAISEAEVAAVGRYLSRERQRAEEAAYRRQVETQGRVNAEVRESVLERAVEAVLKSLEAQLERKETVTWRDVKPTHKLRSWEGATEDIVGELEEVPWLAVEEYAARNGRPAYRFRKVEEAGS